MEEVTWQGAAGAWSAGSGGAVASRALPSPHPTQELLALKLALEEGCGPGPGLPTELSFTKSSQAVRTVRDVLLAACTGQWGQLQGLGTDEDGLQKLGSEGECPPRV